MGLFDSISKEIEGVAGGSLLGGAATSFLFPEAGAAEILFGASIGGSLFADDPQVRALREAGRIEEAARLRLEKQQQFFLEQTAGQREAGREAIGQLRTEAAAPLGQSPSFREAQRAGTVGIAQQLRPLVGQGSSFEAQRQGALTAGLLSGEEAQRSATRRFLAGGTQAGFGPAISTLGPQAQLASQFAQTTAGVGGTQAASQQALLGNLLQLGFLSQLGQQQELPEATGGFVGPGADLGQFKRNPLGPGRSV
jgi:hypothetical protein